MALPAFDPRRMPVVGIDAHLPKIAPHALQAPSLQARFGAPRAWNPEVVAEPLWAQGQPVDAAVLVPLVQRERGLTVLLTERTAGLSSHSGQVAFPGGKRDPEDADSMAAALREAEEEVGLARTFVDVLGALPVYTTGTGFMVTPVVALVRTGFVLTPSPHEVADVFEVPLAFLMDPANHRRHAVDWAGVRREWFSMPYADPEANSAERFIWGATAGMLRNLYRFLLD